MKKFSENIQSWVISGVVLSLAISAVSSIDSTPWKPYVWNYENKCKTYGFRKTLKLNK